MAGFPGSPCGEALLVKLKPGLWGDDVEGKPVKDKLYKDKDN